MKTPLNGMPGEKHIKMSSQKGRRRIRSWTILLIFLSLGAPLRAATWRGDALLTRLAKAPWRIGPFRIQPQIVLTDFGYDSNLYHQTNAVKDYTFTLGPQIDAFLALKNKIIFTLSESPRYVYFYETERERTWNNYLSADINILMNKIFISAGSFLNNVRQRINYEIDFRPRFKTMGTQILFHWQPKEKTSFSASFRQSEFRHENIDPDELVVKDLLDRTETSFTISAFMQWTAKTRFFIEWERADIDFINSDNPRDGRSNAVYSGFEFSDLGRIRGIIRLGYKAYDSRTINIPDFKGIVGDSSVQITLLRPLVVRGSYIRDVRPSTWAKNPFFVENQWAYGASFYFPGRRFRLDYNHEQTRYDYPEVWSGIDVEDGSDSNIRRRDSILVHTIGLLVRISGDAGLGIEAGRYNRKNNIFGWNINRDFVRLSLKYEF